VTADVVVVGSGSAGGVIARRLVDAGADVCLVEAGALDENPAIHDPGRLWELWGCPDDWAYVTVPQAGCNGRQLDIQRGKVLGGSSCLNGMIYIRGHRSDYDAWAAAGCGGWSYEDVLPLFRRSEDFSRGESEYHGAGGPLHVSADYDPHPLHAAAVEAAQEVGVPFNDDHNGPIQDGVGYCHLTVKDNVRQSQTVAFLRPVLDAPNLTVLTGTRARRLVLEGGRCVGVDIGGLEVRAEEEVVLCAGAIESPKLLMLSGIGPGDALRAQRIPVVLDLAGVGGNLQDHLRVSVRWQAKQPLAPSTVSAGLFTYSTRAAAERATAPPDIQFYVGRGLDVPDPFVTLTVAMSQPASRGRLTLRSADPLAPPMIRANYLSESSDMSAMVEGVRLAQSLGSASAYDPVRGAAVDPPESSRSDADIRAFIRRSADTIFHPAGTCAMGTGRDAVVDPQLRVHGLTGLRIADASIFPVNLNSQIHAACVVIGEKAAQLAR